MSPDFDVMSSFFVLIRDAVTSPLSEVNSQNSDSMMSSTSMLALEKAKTIG